VTSLENSIGGRLAVLAQRRTENFPVAPRLLPRRLRAELNALYGFARLVDDIGDESPGNRPALHDELDAEVHALAAGRAPAVTLIRDLAPLVERGVPTQPLHDLIQANRIDQTVHRYQTFDDLLGYCKLSANPVGQLVLHVLGAATPERTQLSDRICTALQIIEHCQDVAEDYGNGRVYLPQDDLNHFNVGEEDLSGPTTPRAVRELVKFEANRAHHLLDSGAALTHTFHGRIRLLIAGFLGGGRATLKALANADYDVLNAPPRAGKASLLRHTIRAAVTRD
jgi:squalene synthase HpnC